MTGTTLRTSALLSPSNPGLDWQVVGAADINRDGYPDIIFQNRSTGDLSYWLMNGITQVSAGFFTPSNPGSAAWRVAAVADFNKDGKPDLVFSNSSTGILEYWLMDGSTQISAGLLTPDFAGSLNWQIVGPR